MTAAPFTHRRYRQMLHAGKTAGYRFAPFSDVDVLRQAGERACLLRHDCDNDLVAAVRLAEIEAEEEVRSTYFVMLRSAMYNLFAPTNAALVRRILAAGHWLALHFDESVVEAVSDERLVALVDRERALLSEEFSSPVAAVSFHQPGRRILDNRVKFACVNTYDREALADFHYTSDSNLEFRGGDPIELFAAGTHARLQVLIHPEWWTEAVMPLADKWRHMLANNLELAQGSLLRREATFTDQLKVSLAPGGRARS
jgi:hypothetical protein